ncbi:MAG: response regulator transcription factor [Hyphomicrobiaceae bacterium]|nr:response regulator transcription factor [Hyphomicrobiaceae bacterium]
MRVPDDHAAHLLVVDDDNRIRQLLKRYLGEQGFRVSVAADAAEARIQLSGLEFDAMVLDVMMPGESGLEFLADLRKRSTIPVLMLTARAETDDRVEGLETGADDYLPKPFEPRELLLRLNNLLKRRSGGPAQVADLVVFGPYAFNLSRNELRRGEEVVYLTEREREIMTRLAARPNSTVPRHELVEGDAASNDRAIDVQITRLRRKIEVDPATPVHIQTVRGVGYRLTVD